ncbi:MAG: nucleotidyl transferase AbiEii/AbiGii toxin family protein [Bacteroidales bacterium]|nr:nucleotidyl transferase AbiEii/AbiGii toxin family protein [Bacteroidales bacterium]MBQ6728780.1 nucleotidyl transferase AbiEii/AbiGii toxin family protein [Bacteroidales bacterium]
MLHYETIAPATRELLNKLMSDDRLQDFILVGGTSLALQLGHRLSVDLDLFTNTDFNEDSLRSYLEQNYQFQADFMERSTVKGEIDGVQIDCIAHCYPWLKPCMQDNGWRLAQLEDIAAMKLNAIAGNGTRIKDFIDMAYLSSVFSLEQMLGFYEQKYHSNTLMPLKGLIFFDDINKDEPVYMADGKPLQWKRIEKRLLSMDKYPKRIFEAL